MLVRQASDCTCRRFAVLRSERSSGLTSGSWGSSDSARDACGVSEGRRVREVRRGGAVEREMMKQRRGREGEGSEERGKRMARRDADEDVPVATAAAAGGEAGAGRD